MKRLILRFLFTTFLLVMLGTLLSQSQAGSQRWRRASRKILGIDKILKSKPPITTGISDAVTEVPFLDDFYPEGAVPMGVLPRTPEGGFVLEHPGNYVFESQSYCLKAGTYAPSEGRGGAGYLYAPQKGPQVDIVRNILQNSVNHPEIPQHDIQTLLWAVISRTKIRDMSRKMRLTAAKLLTLKEIFRINGGALGLIPKRLVERAFEKLPPAVRRILEAEARLREMITKGRATYKQIERVAVLFGDPPFQEGDREVPQGRWSFHPDGYFIRYFPRGYSRILIELSVPELFNIEHDERGRITSIVDKYGNRIETDYEDTIEPLSIFGESSLKGYAFRSVRFECLDLDKPGEKLRAEWTDVGWTFLGVPAGGGRVGPSSDRFNDLKERYEWCKGHKRELDNLEDGLKKIGGGAARQYLNESVVENIMALGHYAIALKKVIMSSGSDTEDWVANHIGLVKKAWQYEVSRREGGSLGRYKSSHGPLYAKAGLSSYSVASIDPIGHLLTFSDPETSGGDTSVYNPCCGIAQPGQGGRQRLNQSGRGTEKYEKCEKKFKSQKIEAYLEYQAKSDACQELPTPEERQECSEMFYDEYQAKLDKYSKEFSRCIGQPPLEPIK